jgi:hypothetical protein
VVEDLRVLDHAGFFFGRASVAQAAVGQLRLSA